MTAAACGGSENEEEATARGGGTTVTIKDFDYSPRNVEAKVGEAITVVNEDAASHSLTAEDKAFDTGSFGKGKETITVDKPGSYTYFCTVHPFMPRGVIQVSA